MRIGILSAAALAFLYASPVLGKAIAFPQEDELVAVESPDSVEVVDVQQADTPDNNGPPPPDAPPADQSVEQPVDQQPDQPTGESAAEPPAAEGPSDSTDQVAPLSLDESQPIPTTMEVLPAEESAAIAELSPESNSTEATAAMDALDAATQNLQEMENNLQLKKFELAQSQNVDSMDVTIQSGSGLLEASLKDLPQETDGTLKNINVCQGSTVGWNDNTDRSPMKISLGKTMTLDIDAILYQDSDCTIRIDSNGTDSEWPPKDDFKHVGDRVPFWFKLLGLSAAQLLGQAPLPNGVLLTPLSG
ncbi:hypothetical protein DRE_01037 [Drechslerella stenobrocha 248]|uniref:Uncharacterized protein n=1 Tax=Drechslerella stenobrocha 248 TaxID=1043628 RepID=W7HYG7_9PEZI|nr:hypothetical protein DRE_01037 [Drechslerella stenobrocha 248]